MPMMAGKRIFIPRIPMIPSDNIFPFHIKRKQFPGRPAFAITSNKAQGQMLSHVGINFFLTGFLFKWATYVAMSRAGPKDSPQNLLRPWSIYQQCGLQTSPASVSKVSHTNIYYCTVRRRGSVLVVIMKHRYPIR